MSNDCSLFLSGGARSFSFPEINHWLTNKPQWAHSGIESSSQVPVDSNTRRLWDQQLDIFEVPHQFLITHTNLPSTQLFIHDAISIFVSRSILELIFPHNSSHFICLIYIFSLSHYAVNRMEEGLGEEKIALESWLGAMILHPTIKLLLYKATGAVSFAVWSCGFVESVGGGGLCQSVGVFLQHTGAILRHRAASAILWAEIRELVSLPDIFSEMLDV